MLCCCDSPVYVLLARYNSSGVEQWAVMPSGGSNDTDPRPFAVGSYSGGCAVFYTTGPNLAGTRRIAHFDSSGNENWDVAPSVNPAQSNPDQFLCDSSGNVVYVIGGIVYSLKVADGSLNWTFQPSVDGSTWDGSPSKIAAYDDAIQMIGSHKVVGSDRYYGCEITKAGAHSTDFYTSATSANGPHKDSAGKIIGGDRFVRKLSASGGGSDWLTDTVFTSSGLAIDSNDDILAKRVYMRKLDSSTGASSDITTAQGDGTSSIFHMGPDYTRGDSVIISWDDNKDWGTSPGYSQTDNIAMVNTADSIDWTATWADHLGGTLEKIYGVAVDYAGGGYVCGDVGVR